MAHFAELDNNNNVINVIVVHNNELLIDGVENEQKGIDFCVAHYGGRWIQTSYNNKIRGNYAGIGMIYSVEHNLFIEAKCHNEAVLNVKLARWDCTNQYHNFSNGNN
jgi:hypothetical protein